MLIKLSDHLRPTNALQKTYTGRVLMTDEGEKDENGNVLHLGRVKCSIQGLMEDISDLTKLPWIYPEPNNMSGGSNVTGGFHAPLVGSYVNIRFPFEDIYSGFYYGNFIDPNTYLGIFNEDYPDSYGHRDEQNTYWKVNKSKKTAEFHHTSGANVAFDADSTITMTSHTGMKFVSEDGHTVLFFDMQNGTINMAPKDGFTIGGPKTLVNPSAYELDTGDVKETISGAKDQTVVGAYRKRIGGSLSQTVVGSVAESATGDFKKLIAQHGDYTYGLGKSQDIVLGDDELKILVGDRSINLLLGDYSIDMILGNYSVDIKAGNIDMSTIAGSIDLGNLLGKLSIGIPGDITIKNPFGKVTIDPAGGVEVSNNLGSLKISPVGSITMDASLTMTLKSLVQAEISGLTQTIVGSGAGITMVNGSIVLLGGGGLPVARVGDITIGVGNLGIPVISNIVLGSFKVLSA